MPSVDTCCPSVHYPYVPKLPIKAIIRLCLGPLGSRSPVVSWRFLLRSSAPCFADCKEQTGVGGFLKSEEMKGRGVIGWMDDEIKIGGRNGNS